MKIFLLLLMISLVVIGCTSSAVLLKPGGDTAEIALHGKNILSCEVELLAVTDSTLLVQHRSQLSMILLRNVDYILVPDYRTPVFTKALSLLFPLTFEAIIFAAASSIHATGWLWLSVATAAGTCVLMFSGDPQTSFSPPLESKELARLRLFCRYPQGLTSSQCAALLKRCGQTDYIALEP